jgi:hypothetical protein
LHTNDLRGDVDDIVVEPPDAIIVAHQRSGTHFLQASLASHPGVHERGEFILRYKRRNRSTHALANPSDDVPDAYVNLPGRLNIGIVMYSERPIYERMCGPLSNAKVIHLVRDPRDVAISVAQMRADRAVLGGDFKAHYRIHESPPPHAEYSVADIDALVAKVTALQRGFAVECAGFPRALTLSYEEITGGRQVSEIPEHIATRLLEFLGLESRRLTNQLRKTGR